MRNEKTQQNRATVVFYTVNMLFWFSLYTYGSVLPNHAVSLGANAAMVGLISGSYGFAQMVLRIPVGMFSDRIRNRKIFIGMGLVFAGISSIGLGLSSTPEQLFIFRSIAGIAAAMFVVFPGYITELDKINSNHKIMGTLSAINMTGCMAGILIGGIVVQLAGGKWAFILGGVVAGATIFIWMRLPRNEYGDQYKKHSMKELVSIIKDKDVYTSAGLAALLQFAVFATVYTFNPIIAKNLGISEAAIGLLTALFTMTGILSAILSGTLFKKKFGAKRTITAAFSISGILFVAFPFIKIPVLLFILQIFTGFFMGLVLPILMGQCLKNIPKEKKGTAMGFFQAIYSIGMILGPYIVGIITRYGNIELGYTVVLSICIIAAGFAYYYGREDRRNGLEKY